MSSEILSQDEIDALLFGGADESDDDGSSDGSPQNFDFATQDKIVRGRMPTLEMINERFARIFRISLFNILSKPAEVTFDGLKIIKFGEFIKTMFVPTSLNICRVNPLRGKALFVFDPNLVYMAVENFFGGEGKFYTKIEGRDFTPTESRVINLMRDASFVDFQRSWENVMPIGFEFLNTELNPQFANIVSPTEVVVVSSFQIELEGGGGKFHTVLPYSMVEPIRELLSAGIQSDTADLDERWQIALQDEVQSIDIELTAVLGQKTLPLTDILTFKEGDVVPFDMRSYVMVYGPDRIPVFKANYGQKNGKKAIQVIESIERPKGSGVSADGASGEIDLF